MLKTGYTVVWRDYIVRYNVEKLCFDTDIQMFLMFMNFKSKAPITTTTTTENTKIINKQ